MKKIRLFIISILLLSCVEEFDAIKELQTDIDVTSILVVEGTITDELKQQQLILMRASSFSDDSINRAEINATVTVTDDLGQQFQFSHSTGGIYTSNTSFAAQQERSYQLKITSQNGTVYESTNVSTPQKSTITGVKALPMISDVGQQGVGIFVNAQSTTANSLFLRYTYEETYKIIAPLWSPLDLEVIGAVPPYTFNLVPKTEEKKVCYSTQFSNSIIQGATDTFTTNNLQDFLVRFIPIDDYIISHRYSILINQLSQSPDAYGFYDALNKQSTSNDLFSTIQPGFIEGNIRSTTNENLRVIGFFEVASIAIERIFFNYSDLFPEEELPPYAVNCNFLGAPEVINAGGNSPLGDAIRSGQFVYVRDNNGEVELGGPYLTALRECGDCTALGSNIVPDFWIE